MQIYTFYVRLLISELPTVFSIGQFNFHYYYCSYFTIPLPLSEAYVPRSPNVYVPRNTNVYIYIYGPLSLV